MKNKTVTLFIIYLVSFFLIWWLWWLWILPYLEPYFQSDTTSLVITFIAKVIFWVVPVVYYVQRIDHKNPWSYLKLTTNLKRGLLWSLALLVVIAPIWIGFVLYLHLKTLNTDGFTFLRLFDAIVKAALIEEIVMRGFILNKLREFTSFLKANLLTALIFVAIHWQLWIALAPIPGVRLIGMTLSIFVLAIASGYLLKKSNSLWPSVVLHSIQNIIAIL